MSSYKGPLVTLCAALNFVALEVFGKNELLVLVALILVGIAMLAANWSLEHVIVYAAMLAIGIVTEILSVREGLWSYATVHSFGFPLWIPFMWSNGALFVVEMKEWIDMQLRRRRV